MNAAFVDAFAALGVAIPNIFLPGPEVDLSKFAVVACDQHVSDPSYWEAVEAYVGDAPSALRLMLPEAYLEQPDRALRVAGINAAMQEYLDRGLLREVGEGFVYLQRTITTGVRHGLMMALDLEQYDYTPGAKSLIRATEQTIPERLPPRVEIRRDAVLELPHIMVLVDDPDNLLLGAVEQALPTLPRCYDFDLMQQSGHLTGWLVQEEELLLRLADALKILCERGEGLLFAMGDGNHSLATAKACWEQQKRTLSESERATHPARFALCEIVNLHDEAMVFEPIHRVLFSVDEKALERETGIRGDKMPPLQQLQPLLDAYLAAHPETRIDYVHGEQAARDLGSKPGNLALLMPPFDKSSLYDIVRHDGVLVRKSFSLGEAPDKRFYLEARKITR